MNKIEIVICTEKGYLESMSKLLIASLREFGGRFRDVPIFSYQPRKKFKISSDTISFFEKNNVEYIDIELNQKFPKYPLANKPLACAHREMHTDADTLVFLDTDVFFLNEPSEFIKFESADVILRPVDGKNIGTQNSGDKNAIYWNNLYKLLNVKSHKNIRTTVTNEDIWEYYNSGHIVTLTKNNLFNTWRKNFEKVMDAGIRPDHGLFFVEQSVLSATVSQMELGVKHFSKEYNYPLHRDNKIRNKKYVVSNFDSLVSIHYHKMFQNKNRVGRVRKLNLVRYLMNRFKALQSSSPVLEHYHRVNPIEQHLETEKGKKISRFINDFDILC